MLPARAVWSGRTDALCLTTLEKRDFDPTPTMQGDIVKDKR